MSTKRLNLKTKHREYPDGLIEKLMPDPNKHKRLASLCGIFKDLNSEIAEVILNAYNTGFDKGAECVGKAWVNHTKRKN